jgi:hypothetical protein
MTLYHSDPKETKAIKTFLKPHTINKLSEKPKKGKEPVPNKGEYTLPIRGNSQN